MQPRSAWPEEERQARSRLAQLAHRAGLLRGSLQLMRRVCGRPGCRCATGARHASWYLAFSEAGKKQMVFVPRDWLARVRQWVAEYQEARACLDRLSAAHLRRLRQREER